MTKINPQIAQITPIYINLKNRLKVSNEIGQPKLELTPQSQYSFDKLSHLHPQKSELLCIFIFFEKMDGQI